MSQGPRTIDGYTVIRELGRGGMGVVFEVHDPKLDRRLAMKLILGQEADHESLLRFEREARLLARLQHPGVVRVHGVGTSEAGPYFVAERVEGEGLDRVLKRQGALEPGVAGAIVRDLASAVAALHAEGIVHRDLKPGNVILRPNGSPVLIDFGLARAPGSERLTLTGTLLGTPNYMSPEQALGETSQVGPPSDVYALGGVLFALLNGMDPFAGLPQLAVLDAITRLPPPWPEESAAAVPPELRALCEEVMDKERSARPSAEELSRRLRDLLERPLSAEPRRGLGLPLLLACLVALALVLAAAGYAASRGAAPASPTPTASSTPTPTPQPTRTQVATPAGLSPRAVMRGLRREDPGPKIWKRAQELLRGRSDRELSILRARYVSARLERAPTQRLESRDLFAGGMVEWIDDTRLAITSYNARGVFWWPDWRLQAYEKVDLAGGIVDNARPAVLDGLTFTGGRTKGVPNARAYAWAKKSPQRVFDTATPVTAVAAARIEGRALLAVGTEGGKTDDEGTIKIFEVETGALVQTLRGHKRGFRGQLKKGKVPGQTKTEVSSLLFTPDGRYLVSAGFAGDLILWRVEGWRRVKERLSGWGDVRDLALHPTRPLLAVSAGFRKYVRLLDLETLEEVQSFEHQRGRPTSVAFSRDGRFLFAVGRQIGKDTRIGELVAYELERGEVIQRRSFTAQAPNSVSLSPNGQNLAVYSQAPNWVGIFEVYEVDVPPGE